MCISMQCHVYRSQIATLLLNKTEKGEKNPINLKIIKYILQLFGGVFYKCQLDLVGSWCC